MIVSILSWSSNVYSYINATFYIITKLVWSMHLLKVVIIYLDWQTLQKTDRQCCDLSRLYIPPDSDGSFTSSNEFEEYTYRLVIYCTQVYSSNQRPLGLYFIGWAWQGVKSVSATWCRPISFLLYLLTLPLSLFRLLPSSIYTSI